MASPYTSQSGSIGALLRQIQEENKQGPLTEIPQNLPSSPIRNLIQQPAMQTESPDSSRSLSIRPETGAEPLTGATGMESEVIPPAAPPVIGPVEAGEMAMGDMPGNSMMGPQPQSSSRQNLISPVSPTQPRAAQSSVQGLGTRISPISSVSAKSVATAPKPSPTPAPKQNMPLGTSRVGPIGLIAQGLGSVISKLGLPLSLAGSVVGSEINRQKEAAQNAQIAKQPLKTYANTTISQGKPSLGTRIMNLFR